MSDLGASVGFPRDAFYANEKIFAIPHRDGRGIVYGFSTRQIPRTVIGRDPVALVAAIMDQMSPQVMHRLVFAVLMQHLPETQTGPALQLLCDALQHSQNQVRELAVVAIAELPASPSKRVAALAPALKDASPRVRRRAARAIGDQGLAAQSVLAQLMAGLRDVDDSVRRDCAGAMGRLGPSAAPAAPLLVNMLADGETRTRAVVAVALRRMGKATVPALLNGLFSTEANVRERCAMLLTELAPDDPRVAAAIKASGGTPRQDIDEAMLAVKTPPPTDLPKRRSAIRS